MKKDELDRAFFLFEYAQVPLGLTQFSLQVSVSYSCVGKEGRSIKRRGKRELLTLSWKLFGQRILFSFPLFSLFPLLPSPSPSSLHPIPVETFLSWPFHYLEKINLGLPLPKNRPLLSHFTLQTIRTWISLLLVSSLLFLSLIDCLLPLLPTHMRHWITWFYQIRID